MKRLQVVVQRIYAIDVPDDFDYTDIGNAQTAVAIYLGKNNMTADNEFFENMKVICADCGVSLSTDEETKDGKCSSCFEERGQ